jgi:hypothetical protein
MNENRNSFPTKFIILMLGIALGISGTLIFNRPSSNSPTQQTAEIHTPAKDYAWLKSIYGEFPDRSKQAYQQMLNTQYFPDLEQTNSQGVPNWKKIVEVMRYGKNFSHAVEMMCRQDYSQVKDKDNNPCGENNPNAYEYQDFSRIQTFASQLENRPKVDEEFTKIVLNEKKNRDDIIKAREEKANQKQ